MTRKKIITGFLGFLIFMWMCTLISKSIYTTKLPMVSTVMPESKYIEHRVEADGVVIEGGKQAVTVLAGLRVEGLMVRAGDRIEEGDALFKVDLDDLKEMIEEKQSEISSLQMQINAYLNNQDLAQQKKEIEKARAREDYDTTSRLENTDVGRAADQVARAEEALEEFLNDSERWSMGEDEREEKEQELRDALQRAAYAEADARRERDQMVRDAERSVEDNEFPEDADATLSLWQLEISERKADLAPYEKILNNEGIITADISGTITDINVSVGERVPEGAALLLTDDALPCQFKVVLDKEQKKYVGVGDAVSVKLDGSSNAVDTAIHYFSESKSVPGGFETLIDLPEQVGTPGLSGKLIFSRQGDKYGCCIPPQALHKEERRNYVYVLGTREGILGEEYYVEEVNVKVLDQNDNWAAIEPGVIDENSKIITSADKEFDKGDVVRWVE